MALVGTLSGSNGTSNTAITGTLVVANTTVGFPSIPSDATVYAQGKLVSTSDLVTSGTFRSLNSIGDEGGEIFLSKSVTNTTLVDGVTLDVYQNRLRIFEAGGTNRGGYWDVSALGAGVSTNFSAGSASPGGSDTYVQFNDGGTAFGGDASLTYNKTTDTLTVSGTLKTNAFSSGYSKQTTSYNMVVTDMIIGVSGTAASTIRLPAHSSCVNGQQFIIKDEAGNAGTYNITISGSSSPGTDTIDGLLGTLLSNNYGSVTIYRGSDSGKFFIV